MGVFRYDRQTSRFLLLRFNITDRKDKTLKLENDIIDICVTPDGRVFCATSSGVVEFYQHNDKYYWKNLSLGEQGKNTVIRNILYQKGGNIWACSPSSIIQYHIKTGRTKSFSRVNGVDVQELNDATSFYDEKTGIKYFGGIGSFVAISPQTVDTETNYRPALHFLYAQVGGRHFGIDRAGRTNLELTHNDNNFILYYCAPDNIDAYSYQYEYRFDEKNWISNGNHQHLTITNVKPGTYRLQMRYSWGGYTSPAYTLTFRITPPWYLSWWMKTVYWLLMLTIIVYAFYKYYRRQKERRQHAMESLERKHKEDVYESKLRFFTNITHEFAIPISLIVGPCQRILSNGTITNQIRNYALLIQHNCERLNDLIQSIMEFRRIESDLRELSIEQVELSSAVQKITDDFRILAEKNDIDFTFDYDKELQWPTDPVAFETVITNLMSNAFKYVEHQGWVKCSMYSRDDRLTLCFSHNGIPISQEQLSVLFDHHRILERLEKEQSSHGSRNDLGLAISQGLVKLLGGVIHVQSDERATSFEVSLPRLPLTEKKTYDKGRTNGYVGRVASLSAPSVDYPQPNKRQTPGKPTLIIIDDNVEMLWFLNDFFAENYNVNIYQNPEKALRELIEYNPDIIISDVMMESVSGIDICRQLKSNPITAHIPIILLSSINTDEERIKSMKAGADMYIPRPCDMDYLQSAVDKLIKNKEVLKQYYESPLSSMVRMNAKFINIEDKKLYDSMMDIINKNIDNPKLSTRFIAEKMAMTVRSLYRKLEPFTDVSPTNIIRDARLEKARILLVKTNLTVEEICYKSGFSTRGTFYRLFSEKFHCTPKQYRDKIVNQTEDAISSQTDTDLP